MTKLKRIIDFLRENDADWLLISDSVEVRYITGLKSSNMILLIGEEEKHLFTDFRYQEMAQGFCANNGWIFHELKRGLGVELADIYMPGDSVAIQSDQLTLDQFELIRAEASDTEFLFMGKAIAALFSVKTDEEVEHIQKAASIADAALKQWTPQLTAGMSEREAANLLEALCRDGGSEAQSFDTIVLFGERAALPHGVPGESRKLQAGDSVLVDFGCVINGFCSDMTRTFFFKSVAPAIQERYEITLKAQRAGVAAVKPGLTAAEIDGVVRTIIDEAGYGEQFGHGTGHGVGLRIHEQPALNSRDETVLQPGMVITVEPGIYVPGESGVRIEDLLVVTENGCRSLSESPRNLTIL